MADPAPPPAVASPRASARWAVRFAGWTADPGLRRAVAVVIALRLGGGLIAWLSLLIAPPAMLPGRQLPGAGANPWIEALVNPWQRWDSWHYESVATNGYPRGSLEVAFLPVYPLMERALAPVLGGSVAVAGMLVSTVAAIAGLAMVHRLVRTDLGAATADRTVLYLGLAPTAMFLIVPYTEALFLALTAGILLLIRSGRLGFAAGALGLAALTRPQGLLLLLPAAVTALPGLPPAGRGWRRFRLRPVHLLVVATPVIAFGLWLGLTGALVGITPLMAEERGWGSHLAFPWQGLVDGLGNTGAYPGPIYNAITVAAWAALIAVLCRRRFEVPAGYVAYAAISLLPIVFREEGFGNPWASAPRFALVVFPLWVGLALLTQGRRRLHLAVTAGSSVLAAVAVVVFVHNQFVA